MAETVKTPMKQWADRRCPLMEGCGAPEQRIQVTSMAGVIMPKRHCISVGAELVLVFESRSQNCQLNPKPPHDP